MAKSSYFPAIDGLRLLASLNIVFLHLASSSAFTYAKDWVWLKPIVSGPAFSAGLFFVLAGFLFASKFSDPDRRLPVIPFMFSRIAKLYRLHFFCTLLMFFAILFKLSGVSSFPVSFQEFTDGLFKGFSEMENPLRSLFLHLTLLWSFVPELGMKLNEPSWALSGFFICYAVTPAFAKYLFKIKQVRTLWVLLAVSFLPGILQGILFGFTDVYSGSYEARFKFYHMFFPMHVAEYFFGMLIFRLYKEGAFCFLNKNFIAGFCQASGLIALYVSCYLTLYKIQNPALYFIVRHSVPILISGFFIMTLIPGKGFLARFFCIPIIRTIGRSSFYPYLLHLPLITIGWSLTKILGYENFNMDSPFGTFVLILILYTFSPVYLHFKTKRKQAKKNKTVA